MTRIKRVLSRMWTDAQRLPKHALHADDQAAYEQGIKDGIALGPVFAKEHADELARLVMTYSDADATDMLDALRECFWSGEWERTITRRDKAARQSSVANPGDST